MSKKHQKIKVESCYGTSVSNEWWQTYTTNTSGWMFAEGAEPTTVVYWDGNTSYGWDPVEKIWVDRNGNTYPQTSDEFLKSLADERSPKMARGLYIGFVVDPETDEVVYQADPFVAKDNDSAKMKLVVFANNANPTALKKDADELDFVLLRLGDVRAKKEVQEVRLSDKKS